MIGREDVLTALGPFVKFVPGGERDDNVPAICPFHKGGRERSPSLYVYVGPTSAKIRTGTSFCHTCKRSWSLASMLRELGVPNGSMPIWLGMIEQEAREDRKRRPPEKVEFGFTVLPEQVLGVFEYVPKLMLEWGYKRQQLRKHEIGFDRAAKRITFPLRNHLGELVGVSGRTVCDAVPRYKVYRSEFAHVVRDYSLDKGQLIWGLDKIYDGYMCGRLDGPIVVCEGFKAALSVERAGFPATVAILGSYLTKKQMYLLERVANDVVLFLDNDAAGLAGTAQILNAGPGFAARVARYPTDRPVSPDDLSDEDIRDAIRTATPSTQWRLEHVKGKLRRLGEEPG